MNPNPLSMNCGKVGWRNSFPDTRFLEGCTYFFPENPLTLKGVLRKLRKTSIKEGDRSRS